MGKGIFSGITIQKKNSAFEMNTQRAVLLIVYSAIKADDLETEKESLLLVHLTAKSPLYEMNTDHMDELLIQEVKQYWSSRSNALDTAIEFLSPEKRKMAFVMACEAIFVDGIVNEEETTFIHQLRDKMQIDEDVAKAAVQTFNILYR